MRVVKKSSGQSVPGAVFNSAEISRVLSWKVGSISVLGDVGPSLGIWVEELIKN